MILTGNKKSNIWTYEVVCMF